MRISNRKKQKNWFQKASKTRPKIFKNQALKNASTQVPKFKKEPKYTALPPRPGGGGDYPLYKDRSCIGTPILVLNPYSCAFR